MPFYVGTTRPSRIGWTRIGLTVVAGLIATLLMASRSSVAAGLLVAMVFALLTLWTWMGQHTRFVVDERGVTVSLGGFLPRRPWPLEDFRTVQYRTVPASSAGVTLGGYGWRRGTATSSTPEEITPLGDRKIFTTGEVRQPYRMMVTRPGTLIEIIGRSGTNYLLSPDDLDGTAEALGQAIRAHR
ncbi:MULTISPECIES: hypothetical protein [Brachybacterium]|uniref:hypothetical protein n=1 Tax=Brachybacterium TaxID=43668 RepID=UPI000DF48B91|nr:MULTISPECIES: hypothetical protein [Brachybacterium]RCS65009.1 hypothetical protein CIK81_06730 [Brachybacterium sp. JB7]RCS76139.1 hypothetical protein CIK68_02695 [Brachybacterium alimentarium]RCS85324.1 hypothetical protein CIK69_16795 [Brachybacterium alimentarium]RCS85702.1 hypothetical protein CIK67_06430 [Brachybacterium alimentarium]